MQTQLQTLARRTESSELSQGLLKSEFLGRLISILRVLIRVPRRGSSRNHS